MMKQMIGSLFVLLIGFFPFGILQMNAAPSAFLHKQQVTVYTGDSLGPSQAAIQKTAKMCETSLNGSLMPTSWTAKQPFSQVRN